METFDYQTQFDQMKKDTVTAFEKALNIDAPRTGRKLQVSRVWVDDNSDPSDWESQRQAVRGDKTWGVPVYASIDLVDRNTGKVLSRSNGIKVATLPKATDLGTFIVNGKHYQILNQNRRRPGVYVTQKENHDLTTEVHIAKKPFKIDFDSGSGLFSLNVKDREVPLYPILSQLGYTDTALAKAWGKDALEANRAKSAGKGQKAVIRAAEILTGTSAATAAEAETAIRDFLSDAEIDPKVTKTTLGKQYHSLSPEVLVRGSEELLKVHRGERNTDDRHALENKKIMSASDLIRERMIRKDGSLAPPLDAIRQKIFQKLNSIRMPPSTVGNAISTNAFSPLLEGFYKNSELAMLPDQVNPLQMLSGMSKVTILGEGGIADESKARHEEHLLHPSHMGFLDPIHTPDSGKIGITTTMPIGVAKGEDGDLLTRVLDVKSGKHVFVSPNDVRSSTIAFPDQFKDGKPIDSKVKAHVRGETRIVNAGDVDYVLSNPKQAYSASSNAIPFLPAAHGVRAQMATKMIEQAIPLKNREAPLVQVSMGKETLEKSVGEGYSIQAKEDGVVERVTAKKIIIKTKDGVVEHPIYDNLPLNAKSFLHAEPTVKAGDKVAKGQVIADSNFTKGGELAIGTNLRTAYIPYKGLTFEDGIVISQAAAHKLASEHMYKYGDSLSEGSKLDLQNYLAHQPGDLNVDQRDKLDDSGVVKKGQILKKGDPMWVGVRDNASNPDVAEMLRYKPNMKPISPFKETWDSDYDGEVVDVVHAGGKVKVFVKTVEPAQVGDKITGRHGGKGIITAILPDGEAPHTADGKPIDILLNPHGIPTRMNPSQMLETMAGKIAKKTGKPYVVDNFSDVENHSQKIDDEMKAAGVSPNEELFDPATNKKLGDVLVGDQYILKLTKQATSQFSARSDGKYDMNKNPLRGGDDGAKSLDLLTLYSMLAHGSRANLKEMATYKATQNEPFWQWLEAGSKLGLAKPAAEPTFAYKKFEAYLKGAGVNVTRNGSKVVAGPMTDREVANMSSGAVKTPLFFRAKDLREEAGGFMDPAIFGANEDKWGHIELPEPVANPVFETAIRNLTGLKKDDFDNIAHGKVHLNPATGELNAEERGLTGGHAFKDMLSKVDVDVQIKDLTNQAKKLAASKDPKIDELDKINKKLRLLHALKKVDVRPEDAYLQTKIPVLPPQFRKILKLPDGSLMPAGVNMLYRDVGLLADELAWQNKTPELPDSVRADLRENLYGGIKALAGLGNPVSPHTEDRRPKGFIEQIEGDSPKEGFFHKQILSRRQNVVGRGTIIPDPKLGVDEVGLPEDMSWQLFRHFAVQKLVSTGYAPNDAVDAVDAKTPAARSALEAAMEERPVMLNRAPSLHKFSIMAFKPKITDGKAVKIPPLVVKGFNADFDGDAMTVHVPILQDAIDEAKKMLPSRNLYNPGTGGLMIAPQNEAALGLWMMSADPSEKEKILKELPESVREKYKDKIIDKKTMHAMLGDVATADPVHFGKTVDKLKEMGDEHTYRSGFTVSINDLLVHDPKKKGILDSAAAVIGKETGFDFSKPENKEKALVVLRAADKELQESMKGTLAKEGNRFYAMVHSGARGDMNQLKQVLSAPMIVSDHNGKEMAIPVTKSLAEGLPFSDYWNTLYGARAVATDKQLQTAKPGAFNKDILATTINNVISDEDCGDKHGISLNVASQGRDIEDRFLAKDIHVGGKVLAKAGSPVTSDLLTQLRSHKINDVQVRSPLTCKAPKGTCAKCYGLDERGGLPPIGENVGAISGQALSEPLTQMTLKVFHGGGLAGSRGIISGYDKIDKLLSLDTIKRGKAILATEDGTVTKIEDAPGGAGKHIFLNDTDKFHSVPNDVFNAKKVRVGSKFEKGDQLSDGLVQPQELVKLKGYLPAKDYIVQQIQDAYGDQNVKLKRRAVESVIRSIGNTTKIIDPGDSEFLHGDVAPFTMVEDHNSKSLGKKKIWDAIGHALHHDVGDVKKHTVIDERVAKVLEDLGHQEVEIGNKQIVHAPFLKGLDQIPTLRRDWMAQLGYQRLGDAIIGAAQTGGSSDLHNYSPIPAFAYGAEFGDPPAGTKAKGAY